MLESPLKHKAPPLFSDCLRIVPYQMLELVNVLLHRHISLLLGQEFSLLVLLGCIWKVFLQETSPEVGPIHWLIPSLHLSLHACPPIFSIIVQLVHNKGQLLLINTIHHSKNLFALAKPGISFIRGGPTCEFCGLMSQKILHRCHPHWCNRRSWLCGNRILHRIHHPMNGFYNLISIISISSPPVSCHCLDMPHFQLLNITPSV